MAHIGASLARVEPGHCEIHVAFSAHVAQQHGYFHGGVVGALADNAGAYAAFTLLPASATVLTVEYKLNFLAPASGTLLVAHGHVLRAGRTLLTCQTDVFVRRDGGDALCAVALVTMRALEGRPDRPA